MSKQEQLPKTKYVSPEEAQEIAEASAKRANKVAEKAGETATKDIVSMTDELLDEIDAVLIDNAEQFVNDYVQKGGE